MDCVVPRNIRAYPKESGRHSDPMITALNSGASSPGSSPGWGHCVVLLGNTLYFRRTWVYKLVPANLMLGDNPAMD